MKNRLDANLKIYEILGDFILDHPDLRFIQVLYCLSIVNNEDRFHEEPNVTLEKIKQRLLDN